MGPFQFLPRRARRFPSAAGLLVLAGFAALSLAGCGGGGDEAVQNTTPGPVAESALECERLAYPCTWAQVDRALIERSDELARAVRERVDGGSSTADAVAWLRAQATLAEVQFDDTKIRFRLPGSRAVWAAKAGSMRKPLPAGEGPSAAATVAPTSSSVAAQPSHAARRQSVIRPGAQTRSALVLAPWAYEHRYMRADGVATILQAMPDYAGHVTLRENLAVTDEQVTVADFRGWDQVDVVFVAAHGGEICWDPKTGVEYHACKGAVSAQRSNNPVIDAIEDNNVGVELLRYEGYANFIVTEDFFRHEYPQGLNNRLVYFDTCASWNAGILAALQGGTGVYMGWAGDVTASHSQWLAQRMFELLAAGIDIKEATQILAEHLTAPSGATLHASDRWLRIRDLISVQDAYTGLKLTDDSGIEVGMHPGDGQPDHALLEVTLDGIRPENADAYVLDVLLESKGLMSIPVGVRAQHLGNYRWKLPLELPLGIDAQPGQRLPLQFAIRLPGGGGTFTLASPKVNEVATMPLEWTMTSTTVQNGPVATVMKTASLVWELEPDTRPDARYRYYRVKSGTMVYEYSGDFNNCRVQFTERLEIPPEATNHSLKFDTGANPSLFTGFAQASNRAVNVQGTCADGSTLPYATTVGGVYLYADNLAVNGNTSFSGSWNDGAGTQISFQFTKSR
jgi:hypothetical protein